MQQLSQLGRSTTTDPTDPIEHKPKISISITLYKELIIKSLVIKFRMCELEGLITGQWHTMQRLYHSAIQPSIQIGFYSITNKHKQRNLWKWSYIMFLNENSKSFLCGKLYNSLKLAGPSGQVRRHGRCLRGVSHQKSLFGNLD